MPSVEKVQGGGQITRTIHVQKGKQLYEACVIVNIMYLIKPTYGVRSRKLAECKKKEYLTKTAQNICLLHTLFMYPLAQSMNSTQHKSDQEKRHADAKTSKT